MKKRADLTLTRFLFIFLSCVFLFGGVFYSLPSYSQQTGTVSGKVLDANSSPLQGATVKLKANQQIAAITDAEGSFKIPAKVGDVLIVQSVGYEDQEVNVTDNSPILLHLKTSYTNTFGSTVDYYKRSQVGTLFSHPTNDLNETKNQNVLVLLENTLNYNKNFGKHSLQALAGYTYQNNYYIAYKNIWQEMSFILLQKWT